MNFEPLGRFFFFPHVRSICACLVTWIRNDPCYSRRCPVLCPDVTGWGRLLLQGKVQCFSLWLCKANFVLSIVLMGGVGRRRNTVFACVRLQCIFSRIFDNDESISKTHMVLTHISWTLKAGTLQRRHVAVFVNEFTLILNSHAFLHFWH